jgi:hypothetical protein
MNLELEGEQDITEADRIPDSTTIATQKFGGEAVDDFIEVDNKPAVSIAIGDVRDQLENGQIYEKFGQVRAIVANGGEEIETNTVERTEASEIAKAGDYIVTNPGGERYIVSASDFTKKYEATDENGVYNAKGIVRGIMNPTGQDITITTKSGKKLLGDFDAMIVVSYNPETDQISDDIRLVNDDEFLETYRPVEEERKAA